MITTKEEDGLGSLCQFRNITLAMSRMALNLNKEDYAMILKKTALFLLVCSMALLGCSPGNLDYVKTRAEAHWLEYGMTPVAYEGFQWGFWGLNDYGGAHVWYRLRKIPDNGIIYTGYLQRWGDELHIYGPKAIDAIKP